MDIAIRGLNKAFGNLSLYRDFDFDIEGGRVTAITGPSGCGKTTFLRMIAGLESPDSGRTEGTGEHLRIGYVFQEDRLLPWLTVNENLKFVLLSEMGKDEAERRAREVLGLMELSGFGGYYPDQLSGGMRRRVAMGRALAYDGDVTLMDEPFNGLDDELKEQIVGELASIWKERKKTIVLVTHNREDGLRLADRLYEFRGRPVTCRLAAE